MSFEDAAKFPAPAYVTVKVWSPAVMPSVLTEIVTEPPDSVPEPTAVDPSSTVTVPPGFAVAAEVTVTGSDTVLPTVPEVSEATTVVAALLTVSPKVVDEVATVLL